MNGSTAVLVLSQFGQFGASAWVYLACRFFAHRRSLVRIEDAAADPPPSGWPGIAVVFAARDEAATVGRATRSMLGQDYPGFELIAVDDRSTDGTGAILDALAVEDARLRVVHVAELPPGWLGKTHALQTAFEATSAAWVLFTDADVILAPDTLRRAVAWAVSNDRDHVTLAPEILTESAGERAFLAMFCLTFAFGSPPWRIADPSKKAFAGVGAFNLVRAEAFAAVGGFRRLALSVDDDMRLGQVLKYAGYRVAALLGQSKVSVRWQSGLGGMVRGLEKNFYAGLEFRLWLVPVALVFFFTIGVAPHLGLFVGPWWARVWCGVGVATVAAILGATRRHMGLRWYHALLLPVGAAAMSAALLRSVYVTRRNGGVTWRGTLYPLAALREHVRRRNAWTREVWRSTR